MRLFHVSEDPTITIFRPRLPSRKDLDPSTGLVWAISEEMLPSFLTPRNCPRVAYRAGKQTSIADRERYFSSSGITPVVILESKWLSAMQSTTLYLYEFDPSAFVLQDEVAGYYVSTQTQIPLCMHTIPDPLAELVRRNVEVRFVDRLWDIAAAVKTTTLNWSLCRMAFAQSSD